MFKTIKSKFIFFSVFLILLTTALPMYFLVTQLRANFHDRSVVMLNTTLDVIRFALKSAMLTGHQEDLQNVIEDLSENEGIYNIRIFGKDGVIRFASQPDEIKITIFLLLHHVIRTRMRWIQRSFLWNREKKFIHRLNQF